MCRYFVGKNALSIGYHWLGAGSFSIVGDCLILVSVVEVVP